jgi:hypothetical protein
MIWPVFDNCGRLIVLRAPWVRVDSSAPLVRAASSAPLAKVPFIFNRPLAKSALEATRTQVIFAALPATRLDVQVTLMRRTWPPPKKVVK